MKTLQRIALLLGALLLAPWAQAQIVNFDTVCPAPPCAVGTLYASAGLAFNPATTAIVAAGTDGLTGTNGGSYLYVATLPNQLQITLARPATFFLLRISRSNQSSGVVTMTINWSLGGTPIGSTQFPLSTVNSWATVSRQIPGTFDTVTLTPSGAASMAFGIDDLEIGGNCFGFADVQPTDSFCSSTEWLGNRGITLGCAVGAYCPVDGVTRAQMALFMNRLGTALTPIYFTSTDTARTGASLAANPTLCQTPDYLVLNYPRRATVSGFLNASNSSTEQGIVVQTVYSTDAGATWNRIGKDVTAYLTNTPSIYEASVPLGGVNPVSLGVGRIFRFGVGVSWNPGRGTAGTADLACNISVRVEANNGSVAPYDAAGD
jgi:hypothetical protein